MNFKVFKSDKGRKKWSIRGHLWDGRFVKLPGSRDKGVAEQMCKIIEILNRCRKFGEPPTQEAAAWIEGLPTKEAERYVKLGLIERKYLDKHRPILILLKDYLAHLLAKNEIGSRHVPEKIVKISRIINSIEPNLTIAELKEDDVLQAVKNLRLRKGTKKGQHLSQKTTHEYLLAIKSFSAWMVREHRAGFDPLNEIKVPPAKAAPVRNRRPLTIEIFEKLNAYVRHAPTAGANGIAYNWKREDRAMTYWTAVMTGLRANELKSLTPSSINFQACPAEVTIEAWNSKNRTKWVIPIGAKLATALKLYSENRPAGEPLFRMPKNLSMVTQYFARDMARAGLKTTFPDGWVTDFHSLRCTAICWWLTINKLNLLEVQFLARLKTLALVQVYARGFKPDYGKLTRDEPDIDGDGEMPSRKAG